MQHKEIRDKFEDMETKELWSSKYDGLNFGNYTFFARREGVKQLLGEKKYNRALDLGCGTGDYVELLKDNTAEYIGIDFAPTMVKKAQKNYENYVIPANFMLGAGEILPFKENSMDLVLGLGYIEYFVKPEQALAEIYRVLKPDGHLVIQSYQLDPYKQTYFTLWDIKRRLLKKLFNRSHREPTVDIKYTKKEFDRLLESNGFKVNDYLFRDYYVFPRIIMKRIFKLHMYLSEKIAGLSKDLLSRFAVNYIVICSKK